MATLDSVTGRLVYKDRIQSVTKDFIDEFRDDSLSGALISLADRFGKNNRKLIGGLRRS